MLRQALTPHSYIDDPNSWQACLKRLREAPRIALDLESNGMFAYREQICLIQISTDSSDFIVDPLADLDLEPLGALLADPAVEKVLHASEYDLILMTRERGWTLNNLFDTMWAARVLGYDKIGLASMLESLYDIQLSKKHQRANWCERPLSEEQLAYAQADTHFLLPMRDLLEQRLIEAQRLQEAEEIFEEQSRVRLPDVEFTADSFWSINGASKLSGRQRAILRELDIFRDREARRRDRPPFKVLHNNILMALAKQAPKDLDALYNFPKLKRWQVRRYGQQLLQAIDRGRAAPAPRRPRRERPDDAVLARYELLKQWRKQRGIERGVASDVVLSREAMWAIAESNPTTFEQLRSLDQLGPVRLLLYGDDIVALLVDGA